MKKTAHATPSAYKFSQSLQFSNDTAGGGLFSAALNEQVEGVGLLGARPASIPSGRSTSAAVPHSAAPLGPRVAIQSENSNKIASKFDLHFVVNNNYYILRDLFEMNICFYYIYMSKNVFSQRRIANAEYAQQFKKRLNPFGLQIATRHFIKFTEHVKVDKLQSNRYKRICNIVKLLLQFCYH